MGHGGSEHKPLYSPARVRDLLTRHGLRSDKGYGQHFLIDQNVLKAVLEASEVTAQHTVLEVGPGLGVLTRELAERAAHVVAVELDARLKPLLQETLADLGNVSLRFEDALRFDLAALPLGSLMVANLPYSIATPLVVRALKAMRFARLAFLVQREVAARMVANPGDAAHGRLSLIVAHFGQARIIRRVKATAFLPPPEVTSSVVRIDVDASAQPDPHTFALVRACFRHRRKTLVRNLVMAGYSEPQVVAALRALGLDPRVRAEKLDLLAFARLGKMLAS